MPLDDREAARATELRRSIEALKPSVQALHQRSRDRTARWRKTRMDIASQTASQALGTLIAAGVAYLVAVAAGALEGTEPLLIIVSSILGLGFAGALWNARALILPSRRAEGKLLDESLELASLQVHAKLRDRVALTMDEAWLLQRGLIRLDAVLERPPLDAD